MSDVHGITRVVQGMIQQGTIAGDDKGHLIVSTAYGTERALYVQPYGLSSRPASGKVILLTIGGTAHAVALHTGDITQSPTGSGEVVLYDGHGHQICLASDKIHITGDIETQDTIDAKGFKCDNQTGMSGTIEIPIPGGVVTIIVSGGLITGYSIT